MRISLDGFKSFLFLFESLLIFNQFIEFSLFLILSYCYRRHLNIVRILSPCLVCSKYFPWSIDFGLEYRILAILMESFQTFF